MTTFEHAMLGINGVLASGLQRRYGWSLVALGGLAAIAPDWDGLPMLVDMARFEHGHRVWGHNLLSCLLMGIFLGTLDYRFDISGRIAKRLVRLGPLREAAPLIEVRTEWSRRGLAVWMVVAILAALSQIPADAVVSGAKGLSDWGLKPFWPFLNQEFVYAMVPWGNVGVTIIFASGMLLQAKHKTHTQLLAIATLACVAIYIVAWGTFVHRS